MRARVALGGTVQGVGFRPFVYRLAKELELAGWVSNSSAGLVVEAEGVAGASRSFPGATRSGDAAGCGGADPRDFAARARRFPRF